MPWPVKELKHGRLQFVTLASQADANIRLLCRRFGISPTVGYKWLERYRAEGASGLQDRSRRPRRSPRQTDWMVEKRVVQLRREHAAWGGRKLRRRLQDLGEQRLPAPSTITEILHRHGLIEPERSQAAEPWQRFERSAPNELWQMDFKGHFALKEGRCHTLCALDDHSRYNVLLQACTDQRQSTVQRQLIEAFRRHGLPDALLWDNGSPWGSGGDGELTGLEVWLLRVGVRAFHGRAFHPQTQGKEERFHRTLQAEVLQRGGWKDCQDVQSAFDQWRPIYNSQRPHEALNLDTPVRHYRPSQRSYPEQLAAVEYDHGVQTRRVDAAGKISYGGRCWKVGRAFVGELVGLRPSPQHEFIEVIYLTHLVRLLDLANQSSLPPDAVHPAS